MRILSFALVGAAVLAVGCGDGDGTIVLRHEFEAMSVEPSGELSWWCQSWRLDNDEPLYVNAVRSDNDGYWHHSNWFFVPEDWYPGDEDTWPCSSRDFDEVVAGVGGGVFFAQSTQSVGEEQRFAPGLAYRIPPRSQIVGNIHLLNLSEAPIESAIRFEIEAIPESKVETLLRPMAFFNRAMELPPRLEADVAMQCDFGAPQDFNVHFVLPHYHELGLGIRIERVGGELSGEAIFEGFSGVGEPWGRALIPAAPMAGATGLRFTCFFDNPRDEYVYWGIGDQEMCVFLSYTDSNRTHGGFAVGGTNVELDVVDGVSFNEAPCQLDSF
jgi:hypothetical protein